MRTNTYTRIHRTHNSRLFGSLFKYLLLSFTCHTEAQRCMGRAKKQRFSEYTVVGFKLGRRLILADLDVNTDL